VHTVFPKTDANSVRSTSVSELVEVKNKRQLRQFIRFPFQLYKDHPCWVPPLFFDEWNTLHHSKNPAYRHCESRLFMVRKGREIVGRIAAIRNDRYIETWKKPYLRFGWIDFEDDLEVSSLLFGAVEQWAREQQLEAVHGPLGFTDLDPEGLLIEGFQEEGTLPMIYNHEYYIRHFEKAGFRKDIDWFQFEITVPQALEPKFDRLKKLVMERNELTIIAPRKKKELLPYAHSIFDVLNAAFAPLYGVVKLDKEQVDAYIRQYFGFVNPDFIKLVLNHDKEVIAFAVAIPRLSRVLRKYRGRLFPFGAFHLLHTLKHPGELVFYLVGVRPDYQNKGINAILMTELYQECIRYGIRTVQTCGELEDNSNIVSLMNNFPHRQHIRRRCYFKTVSRESVAAPPGESRSE
jgi:GNAT superfamily N-acetyltransferase